VIESLLSMPQLQDAVIGIPDMPRMRGAERSLKWEARASPPQKKARAAHAEKHDAG
jgi:hypothetical protein